ncbi:hypothetical protein GGI21_001962 [Coemansia aciculifera]|nr:hypothetical protein GGI21_001962 [Coemansia aciculifera]
MGTILHLANRSSFFTEAEHRVLPLASEDGDVKNKEALAISTLLVQKFGPTWCQGLVAQDVEQKSWAFCVQSAHELASTLQSNRDIPLEYVDMVVPFFVFVNVTVLLRQIRRCKRALSSNSSGVSEPVTHSWWQAELEQCLSDVRIQWKVIQDLGSVWRVDAIVGMLKLMHIDEVVQKADRGSDNHR